MSKALYLVCGDDEFRVLEAARAIVARLVPEESREFGLEVVETEGTTSDSAFRCIRALRESLENDGLFGGGEDKLIWVKNPPFLTSERAAKTSAVTEALTSLTADIKAGLPEGRILLISTNKINRASAFFKAFAAKGEVIDFGSNLRQKELQESAAEMLDEWLPRLGLIMDGATRHEFIARVGTDSRTLISEAEKLAVYWNDPQTPVTLRAIQEISSSGAVAEFWGVLDRFAERRSAELLALARTLTRQGEEPIRIANSLITRVNELITIREALDRKWAETSGAGLNWKSDRLPPVVENWFSSGPTDFRRLPSFRLRGLIAQAALWRLGELRASRHYLITLREALVSANLDPGYLLDTALIKACVKKKSA